MTPLLHSIYYFLSSNFSTLPLYEPLVISFFSPDLWSSSRPLPSCIIICSLHCRFPSSFQGDYVSSCSSTMLTLLICLCPPLLESTIFPFCSFSSPFSLRPQGAAGVLDLNYKNKNTGKMYHTFLLDLVFPLDTILLPFCFLSDFQSLWFFISQLTPFQTENRILHSIITC